METRQSLGKRILFTVYGGVAYCFFFGTILYAIGFVGNLVVPKTIDSGVAGNTGFAIAINALLMTIFAIQHSVMARPAFKRWWTRIVPKPIERSTFVLFSSLALILLFAQWRPIPTPIWDVENQVLRGVLFGLFAFGWTIVFVSTFLINHFALFGLRQVYLNFTGRTERPEPFKTTGFYKYVRHPLMAGFVIAFWAAPTMTFGHLLFAGTVTLYILAAIQLEERDLESFHGEVYRSYRKKVPMLLPIKGASGAGLGELASPATASNEE